VATPMTLSLAGRWWMALLGPVLGLFGLLSYFTLFVNIPALRDIPWINIPLVAIGVAVSTWALTAKRSFPRWAGAALSTLCAAALLGYVFVLSNMLPETSAVAAVGDAAPALTLPDQTGTETAVVDPASRTLLVFYRGHW
jgi:peptidoglycan/LPS O-acetylase OafA/YrhL